VSNVPRLKKQQKNKQTKKKNPANYVLIRCSASDLKSFNVFLLTSSGYIMLLHELNADFIFFGLDFDS